jgi:large subunit ribosomal protein L35
MAKIKMKTNRGAAKRLKVSGSGKIIRRKAYASHLLSGKSRKRKRSLRKPDVVSPADRKMMKTYLPYGG